MNAPNLLSFVPAEGDNRNHSAWHRNWEQLTQCFTFCEWEILVADRNKGLGVPPVCPDPIEFCKRKIPADTPKLFFTTLDFSQNEFY